MGTTKPQCVAWWAPRMSDDAQIHSMEREWTPSELVELGLARRLPDIDIPGVFKMVGCVEVIDPFVEPWRLNY